MTDAELVRRFLEGDGDAFEELYRRHARALYTLALRMLGDAADAEDLLQEIFVLAHDRLATYEGRAALRTWLYRLAVNRCLDHLRSRAARERASTRSLDGIDDGGPAAPRAAPRVSAEMLDLERVLPHLPHSYRAAFVLHDVQGFPHAEVARILGVAEGTSKSLVHKARLRLRAWLRDGPGRTDR